ncbi:ABC transporter ATP-binding protein [Candidatus Omnitrophota bacterium]
MKRKQMFKAQINLILRFLKHLFPYRKKWLVIIILSNATALLALLNPYLTKLVIDQGFLNKDLRRFILLGLIAGGIFLINELLAVTKQFLEQYIKRRVNFDLQKKLFKHTQNLSFSWFLEQSTGEQIYKIENDLSAITGFITNTLPQAFFIFTKLLFILVIVFYLQWRMALVALCLAPVLYIPPYYFSRKIKKVYESLLRNSESIFTNLDETLSHIKLIKVFGKEISSIREYLKKVIVNIRINVKTVRMGMINSTIIQVTTKAIIGLLSLYGGYQVIKGQLTIGSLAAIMIYLYQLIGLQNQFASFFHTVTIGLVSCRRIAEVLDQKPKVREAKGAKNILFTKGQVSFSNVNFGYKPQELILKKMSFSIEGGSHIAIAGPSGCGKTTLLNLIARLYDPWEGEILIDGHNIKDLKFRCLKGQIGFALQEALLWNDTIENNISYAKPRATKDEILKVAEIAGVDEFTRILPQGYQTVIGEDACKISEGQKQKIAIARALIKQPKILILDEAMSSMDSASEEKIISNIKSSQEALTLITVSHRLSTVMKAGLAYCFFRPGEMIVGKPQDLKGKNSEFSRLFSGQEGIFSREEAQLR